MERTFVMIKPDGVKRGLVGEIVGRFENKGMKLVELRLEQLSREKAERLYAVHKERDFFQNLVDYVTSGPVAWMVLEAPGAVSVARMLIGETDPAKALPGTIRGDYGLIIDENIVHGSDSAANAAIEMSVFLDN